jgi:hypothetical protein
LTIGGNCIAAISNLPPVTSWLESTSNRWYSMDGCSNLVTGAWINVPGAGPRAGIGDPDSMADTNQPPRGSFYWMEVTLP